jgi:serine/threonine protein kinase/ankyrin repeat protein
MTDPNRCPTCGCELPAEAGLCPECLLRQGFEENDSLAVEVGEDSVEGGSGLPVTTPPARFDPPPVSELASLFPGLEIVKLLGHGGMGAVYQARQTKLDRLVALKIIRPESASDPAFAERFLREARTLARLSHPSIVGVHDFGEVSVSAQETQAHREGEAPAEPQARSDNPASSDDSSARREPRPPGARSRTAGTLFYFVMEYVDGANLRQLIEAGELAPETAIGIVPQVCEALQFAHDQGIVHRDIKPENILVDSRGHVKIADFGLARLTESSPKDFTLTGTHQVMGTPRYMAPEQMEGSHDVDHRADIYSLGVVFYEMLTGQVPAGHFDPPSKKVQIDVRLDEVVLRSLAREPERRYQQVSEVKTDVESISQTNPHLSSTSQVPVSLETQNGPADPYVKQADVNSGADEGRDPTHMKWSLVPVLGVVGVSIFSFVADGAIWRPHWLVYVADSWVPLTLLWCGDGLAAFFAFRFAYRSSRLEWKLAAFVLTLISLLGVVYAVLLLGQILRRHETGYQPRRHRSDSAVGWILAYLLFFAVPGIWRELALSQDSGMDELGSSDRGGAENRKPPNLLSADRNPGQTLLTNPQLLIASAEGDVERAKNLLQEGADPDTVSRADGQPVSGRTPLIIAAAGGHAPLAALLLMQGADPSLQDIDGHTALMLAAENSHSDVVRVIVQICDQKFMNSVIFRNYLIAQAKGENGVFEASLIPGDHNKLRPIYIDGLFIKSGEALQDSKGETALMKAAAAGDTVCVKLLSGAGRHHRYDDSTALNICEMQDKKGRTAFIHAVLAGRKELIVEACRTESDFPKAESNQLPSFCNTSVLAIRDDDGNSALDLASSGDPDPEIVEAIRNGLAEEIAWADGKLAGGVYLTNLDIPLRQRADAYSALGQIDESKADHEFKEQLDRLDNPTLAGRTFALFEAARQGNVTLVKKQLTEKVDPNSLNPAGETPLMKAVESGDLQTVVALIFRGADEQVRDKLDQTPLMHAARAGQGDVVKLLLEMNQVHVDEEFQFRLTRLDSELDLTTPFDKMRFDAGAGLIDTAGETVLTKAAAAGSVTSALLLLKETAYQRMDPRDKAGRWPLMHAVEAGHTGFLTAIAQLDSPNLPIAGIRHPSTLFYPAGVTGEPVWEKLTVLQYLDENGMTGAAKTLRSKIRQMIEDCDPLLNSQKGRPTTLEHRARFWRELGEIEKAEADEKAAAELKKAAS